MAQRFSPAIVSLLINARCLGGFELLHCSVIVYLALGMWSARRTVSLTPNASRRSGHRRAAFSSLSYLDVLQVITGSKVSCIHVWVLVVGICGQGHAT